MQRQWNASVCGAVWCDACIREQGDTLERRLLEEEGSRREAEQREQEMSLAVQDAHQQVAALQRQLRQSEQKLASVEAGRSID